jgi:hypothetical protein
MDIKEQLHKEYEELAIKCDEINERIKALKIARNIPKNKEITPVSHEIFNGYKDTLKEMDITRNKMKEIEEKIKAM